MVIDLGKNNEKLYLFEDIVDKGVITDGKIYFKSQLSNTTLDYLDIIITQDKNWSEITILNPTNIFNGIDIAGYYIMTFEYLNPATREYDLFDGEYLIKVKNSSYSGRVNSTYNDGQKEYKVFNG